MNRNEALGLLRTAVGDPAIDFRDGQWEAIDALVNRRKKLLVVQRTGWGKSSVYFVATKSLRDRGAGPTIIISPLLSLMRNQIDAAGRLGLHATTINSANTEEWKQVQGRLETNTVDVLLISPERLANEQFLSKFMPLAGNIGMLVIDEAHCISDWGHDFRPDYRRLVSILRQVPANTLVLGTTATANDRVVADVQEQVGNVEILRGSLVRESLSLQRISLPDQASRLAWLAGNIPQMPGTGVVYVLTKRDAELVTRWLRQSDIDAQAYYSGVQADGFEDTNRYRVHLEDRLLNNELKVLVATTALGMGYDKPDLAFVVHYQTPGSIVGYYQQVGRAGRGIDHAYAVLLSGQEDASIHEYFRRSAFPGREDVERILAMLQRHEALSIPKLEGKLNLRHGKLEQALKFLSVENPSPVIKQGSQWKRTPVPYALPVERIERLTSLRLREWQEVQSYMTTDACLMNFLQHALDDNVTGPCMKCEVCCAGGPLPASIGEATVLAAARFLHHTEMPLKPRVRVPPGSMPVYGFSGNLIPALRAEQGRVLSRWGDAVYGQWVAHDKHANHFRDELVQAVADMIRKRWRPRPAPQWVTCVPSLLHPDPVLDFAGRLAAALQLPFVPCVEKVMTNQPQKHQQNSFHQFHNLDGAFAVTDQVRTGSVLLCDDVVDSGCTISVVAALLRQAGAGGVFPVALADKGAGG